jgi:pantoate--beta-alanine ligase
MEIARTKDELRLALADRGAIGFVPTMGALHQGHLSLVRASVDNELFTVASIFVNPTQFNNPSDLEKYPVDTENDLQLLEKAGCHVVFLPSKEVIYPPNQDPERYIHSFGALEERFEGAFRPGHFRGVGQVVHILFELVQPKKAYFGEKDFQQLAVIRRLVREVGLPIEIVGMPTIRESDGLAMSSRNRRLTHQQREEASVLFQALQHARNGIDNLTIDEISASVAGMIADCESMRLEYFGIIDPETFEQITLWEEGRAAQAVIAAYAGEIRLIDNLRLA